MLCVGVKGFGFRLTLFRKLNYSRSRNLSEKGILGEESCFVLGVTNVDILCAWEM